VEETEVAVMAKVETAMEGGETEGAVMAKVETEVVVMAKVETEVVVMAKVETVETTVVMPVRHHSSPNQYICIEKRCACTQNQTPRILPLYLRHVQTLCRCHYFLGIDDLPHFPYK
jgi:hypothetical protein